MEMTSNNGSSVQVVTSVQRSRRFTAQQKLDILNECTLPGMNVSIVARKYGIAPSQVFYWRRRMQEGAKVGVGFGRSLGFSMCMTPAYSPESNGMAEAFVKTFKRDYVYVNDLSTEEKVLEQLPGWFEDYNENAPHSALKMKSPREYIRDKSAG